MEKIFISFQRGFNLPFLAKKVILGRKSAGILLYRKKSNVIEVLLVHPGGPYHANKDIGAWSIPKGEFANTEEPLSAAIREFEEELGEKLYIENYIPLSPVKQVGGKMVFAWLAMCDIDVTHSKSNTFRMQWPPASGKWIDVPEIDMAEWFELNIARVKINVAQTAFLDQLESILQL